MRITEISKPSLKSISESLEANNDTGVASGDLMKLAQQHMHGAWGNAMTADEANQEVLRVTGVQGVQTEAKPGETPSVIFKSCEEYLATLAKWGRGNAALVQKLQEFHNTKLANPMQPFGKNDTRLIATGPLGRAIEGLRHAHLTQDLSIFYTLGGSNPHIIYQYGIYSHNESGTGNSQNIKVQKNLGKRLSNQEFK